MKKVLLSEKIDDAGINLLKDNGFEVKIAANKKLKMLMQLLCVLLNYLLKLLMLVSN